jgi:hypothetical protein
LEILNDDLVGFANISAWEMPDHLFITYGNITLWIWKTILNKCAAHGTLSNLLIPFENRFKIVLIILRQEALSLGTRIK